MSKGFWNDIHERAAAMGEPFFVLAPMADVTDVPFRSIIADNGRPDVFYTEFVSAHGLNSPGRDALIRDLALTENDHPIVAQFFGTEPEHFEAVGKLAKELGFDGVDINMGCPDRSIMKQGAGIAMAKDPSRAQEAIAALRQGAGTLPVSVKTRLGLRTADEMETWLPALLEARPDVLIVHGRTMQEMSKVPAHWDLLGRAAQMAHDAGALFVGNGDVMSREQGLELAERWNIDGIMVGRGIFQNPWLFNADVPPDSITPEMRMSAAVRHTRLWSEHWAGIKSFHIMRKFYKAYVSGWSGSAALRSQLMQASDAESAERLILEALGKEKDSRA